MIWPDSAFAVPVGSFRKPVPVPTSDPDVGTCFSLNISAEWMPYILGALKQLLLQSTWDTDDPDVLTQTQYRAAKLISMFASAGTGDCEELQHGCHDYFPDSPIITYAPKDPFKEPGEIPSGYIAPPFYVVDDGLIPLLFSGAQAGDVVTGYISIPVLTPGIGQGLARFRVTCKGKGHAELHLLNIPHGGSALVTKDGNILSAVFVELNRDAVQIPPETLNVVIVEVDFDTAGDHFIDVTFLPRFNDEVLFIAYGGGLRKVVLCGFDQNLEDRGFEGSPIKNIFGLGVDLNEDISMQIQKKPTDPCIIQMWCIDHWEDWYDPRGCIAGNVAQPPAGGTVPSGECVEYDVVLQGNGQWILPNPIDDGYTITISGASGAWNDGTPDWYCPSGDTFILGACVTTCAHPPGDPSASLCHMRLIATYDSNIVDAFNTSFIVPSGTGSQSLVFQANDGSLNDNSGSISFHVQVCNSSVVQQNVSVDTSSSSSFDTDFVTDITKIYKVTVSGTWIDNGTVNCDAFYYDVTGTPSRATTVGSACAFTNILELTRDGAQFSPIPSYNSSHVYVFYIQGTGSAFSFRFCDSNYANNSGILNVLVEEQ